MKKFEQNFRLSILLILLLTVGCAHYQYLQNPELSYEFQKSYFYSPTRINGNYKQCIIYNYIYVEGQLKYGNKIKAELIKYDDDGYNIEHITFTKDGLIHNRCFSFYNEIRKKVEEIILSPKQSNFYKINYKYNYKGNVIEEITYDTTGIIRHEKYSYNNYGNIIERKLISNYGIFSTNYCYEYNENGLMVKQDGCNSKTNIYDVYFYQYDQNGKMIEENIKSDINFEIKRTNTYDDCGNLKKVLIYNVNTNQLIRKEEYIYSK